MTRTPSPGFTSDALRITRVRDSSQHDGIAAAEHAERAQAVEPRRAILQPCFCGTDAAASPPPGASPSTPTSRARTAPRRRRRSNCSSCSRSAWNARSRRCNRAARGVPQRVGRFGAVPAAHREARRPAGKSRPAIQLMHPRLEARDQSAHGAGEALAQPLDVGAEIFLARHDDLRGGRRRRRAHVGGEVGDREVDLVADGRDDWHRRGDDGSRDDFFVERPQVLDRAAAAADDDDVDARHLHDVARSRARRRRRRLRPARASGRITRCAFG